MKRTAWLIAGLFLLGSFAAFLEKVGLPFLPVETVRVTQPEYAARHVLLQVFAGKESPDTRWLMLGTTEADTRVTVIAPPASGIYRTPGFSSVRQDRPFTVRIDKKVLGFIWVPDHKVEFALAPADLPLRTPQTADEFEKSLAKLHR